MLATQNQIVIGTLEVLGTVFEKKLSEGVCRQVVALLEYLLPFAPEAVLGMLDMLKAVTEENGYDKVKKLVNDIIKKGDLASEPD